MQNHHFSRRAIVQIGVALPLDAGFLLTDPAKGDDLGPAQKSRTSATEYPSRDVTIIVSFAAGGGIDPVIRLLAEQLRKQFNVAVIVENKPGAGGGIGATFVSRSSADGYTLLAMEASTVLAKWLHKSIAIDVNEGFTPIAMFATNGLALFASKAIPVNNVKELIRYSRSHPNTLSVGTPGVGTPHHLAALMFNRMAGLAITHVPYRGSAPSIKDLLSGQIALVWAVPSLGKQFVDEGKIRALAVSTNRRLPLLPDVPTMSESGLSGFDIELWLGIAGPARLPDHIVSFVAEAVQTAIRANDFIVPVQRMGYAIEFKDRTEFKHRILKDQRMYEKIIREASPRP